MRKHRLDKKYLKISLYSFAVLAAGILLYKFLDNVGGFWGAFSSFILKIKDILITFIYGFFIAFFFTPLVNFLEKFLGARFGWLRKKSPGFLRNITILINYAIFIGCFSWLMVYMVPTVAESFSALVVAMPQNMDKLMQSLPDLLSSLEEGTRETVINSITDVAEPIQSWINRLPSLIEGSFKGENFTSLISGTVNVVTTIINFLIGIIISFYMLSSKEEISANCKKMCLAVLEEGKAEVFIQNMQRVNIIFQNFVLGKLLDAIVLGVMCFVGMVFLRIPYALVISVVIGITNMIPYVGPFIGTVPAVFIVLLVNPIKSIWLLVYIIAIQQIDNYIVCPRLLGEPTGLTPLEVLFAIAVGAYFGGALGMFLGVPIVASIKLFVAEAVNRRYREKYPHGTPEFPDEDDELWSYTDDDFVEDIPDD